MVSASYMTGNTLTEYREDDSQLSLEIQFPILWSRNGNTNNDIFKNGETTRVEKPPVEMNCHSN